MLLLPHGGGVGKEKSLFFEKSEKYIKGTVKDCFIKMKWSY